MSTSTQNSNVKPYAPPAPPGPYQFDRSRFSGGTRIVDTANLAINANVVNVCRVRAYGDPADPTAPAVSAPAIGTQIILAPYFDAANVANFTPVALFGNTCTYLTQQLFVQKSVTVGKPFSWTPPTFSTLQNQSLTLTGGNLGQTYPLMGGQVRGYAKLFVPQPTTVPSVGTLYNLNGGVVGGQALLYR